MHGKENPILGGFTISGKSSFRFRCLNAGIGQRSFFIIVFSAFSSISFVSIAYFSLTHNGGYSSIGPGQPPPPPPPPSPPRLPSFQSYKYETCARLDSPFEFESPPDFTKLGIESWTECREVKAKGGWKVEHCTAPSSTRLNIPRREMLEDFDESNNFLFRPEPRPTGQKYAYMTPPTPKSVRGRPPPTANSSGRDRPSQCNPSGYFRVKRMSTPSTDYTLGSNNQNPELRCRNNPSRPISVNETTRDFVDNFAGPDTLRVIIDGPEY